MTAKSYSSASQTISDVISCSLTLFRRQGYKKTTVDEISSYLHISKKTIYSVFPSKEAILREATWSDSAGTLKIFCGTITETIPVDRKLLSFCRFIFRDMIQAGCNGLFWGIHSDDTDIRSSYIENIKRITGDMYEKGKRDGIFKPVDTSLAAGVITNIIVMSLEQFRMASGSVEKLNEALSVIADIVTYRSSIAFDTME